MITINQKTFKIHDFKELIYVTTEKMIISLKENYIIITGHQLEISYFTNIEIHGKGSLDSITFRDSL